MQIDNLKPQRDVLGEFRAGDENRIAELNDWWLYDHERLSGAAKDTGSPPSRASISQCTSLKGENLQSMKPTGTMRDMRRSRYTSTFRNHLGR
jgi:hypothetical protein